MGQVPGAVVIPDVLCMVCNVEITRINAKHVADLLTEDLEGVLRARVPSDDNAAHVGVDLVAFIAIPELHLIKRFTDFNVSDSIFLLSGFALLLILGGGFVLLL